MTSHVKTTRRYDATARRAGALRTRKVILDAAERQFLNLEVVDLQLLGTKVLLVAWASW